MNTTQSRPQTRKRSCFPRQLTLTRLAVPAIAVISLFATGGATGGNFGRQPVDAPLDVVPVTSITALSVAPATISVSPAAMVMDDSDVELMRELEPEAFASEKTAEPSTPVLRTIEMEVTAYCACTRCCGPDAAGITASGRDVSYNNGVFVAADTTVLPFNTRISIPGYHDGAPVEVIDRGGAIKGNRLDVYFPTHEEAVLWGRQILTITVQQ